MLKIVLSAFFIYASSDQLRSPSGRVEVLTKSWEDISRASADPNNYASHQEKIVSTYNSLMPERHIIELLDNLSADEIKKLYFILASYIITTDGEVSVSEFIDTFKYMNDNGYLDEKVIITHFQIYIFLRMFDAADAFQAENPHISFSKIPRIVEAELSKQRRVALAPNKHSSALVQQAIEIEDGVIVLGDPRCYFYQGASAAIDADEDLLKAMAKHAIWLADPAVLHNWEGVALWNEDRPLQALRFADRRADWPEVSHWGTPSFYFLKDGKVVKKIVGWPRAESEERKQMLREGLALIGEE